MEGTDGHGGENWKGTHNIVNENNGNNSRLIDGLASLERQIKEQMALPKHLIDGEEPTAAKTIKNILWEGYKRQIFKNTEHDG